MNTPTPIIAFGDIHGSKLWKKVVSANPDCLYVFLGDYLDDYENIAPKTLIDNLLEIIEFKKLRPNDVVLLFGNHDLHYITKKIDISTRYNRTYASTYQKNFTENLNLFQFAYQIDNYLFTHAGISQRWFENDFKGNADKNIAEQLSNAADEQTEALFRVGYARGGNRGDIGGIFWADSSELEDPLQNFTQIVGHNRVPEIQKIETEGGIIWFCDALWQNQYLKISNDLQKFEICKIKI